MDATTMHLTRAAARALDCQAIDHGIPGAVLMENASQRMAELLRSLGIEGTVFVCCGPGNNGGDGLVVDFGVPRALLDAALTRRDEETTSPL